MFRYSLFILLSVCGLLTINPTVFAEHSTLSSINQKISSIKLQLNKDTLNRNQLQKKLIDVGQSIFETYVLLPFEIKNAEVAPMVQRQMQQQ